MAARQLCGVLLLLCFLEGVSLASSMRIIALAGETVTLPCGGKPNGKITWQKNGALLVKYIIDKKFQNNAVQDISRFNVKTHSTNNLEVSDVRLTDSGNYSCLIDKTSIQTELHVFEVSASPSFFLIMSEDLTLRVRWSSEQAPGQVFWRKDGKEIGNNILEMKNVSIEDGGDYQCMIKLDGSNEIIFQRSIQVKGFFPSPAIVYQSGLQPVTIPWEFNFAVRKKLLGTDAKIIEGNVTHLSQIIKQITFNNDVPCWPDNCNSTLPNDRLDIVLSKPNGGDYRIEILLEMENRKKRLWMDVCVAALTVPASEKEVTMESTVALSCNISCIDENKKLCWHHMNMGLKICGLPGEKSLTYEVAILPETLGDWACSVMNEQKIEVNATVTLKVKSNTFDVSNALFWPVIGAGVILLLLIVVVISIVTVRCRRMHRARHRAWLIQNIHQQKICKCKGFAPIRLMENV